MLDRVLFLRMIVAYFCSLSMTASSGAPTPTAKAPLRICRDGECVFQARMTDMTLGPGDVNTTAALGGGFRQASLGSFMTAFGMSWARASQSLIHIMIESCTSHADHASGFPDHVPCPGTLHCLVNPVAQGILRLHAGLYQLWSGMIRRLKALGTPFLPMMNIFEDAAQRARGLKLAPSCEHLVDLTVRANRPQGFCIELAEAIYHCKFQLSAEADVFVRSAHVAQLTSVVSPLLQDEWTFTRPYGFPPLNRGSVLKMLLHSIDNGNKLTMAELGVRHADTSEGLLAEFPMLHMLLVDPYVLAGGSSNLMLAAMQKLKPFSPRATWMVQGSESAVAHVSQNSLDLIFFDYCYDYEKMDLGLNLWWSMVRSGGIISGHDYNGLFPGSVAAIHDFARKHRLHLFFGIDSVWWANKP